MPFVKIEKSRQGSTLVNEPLVSMGTYLADGRAHKSRTVSFRITLPLLQQLGWKIGEKNRLSIGVQEGTGSDEGYLQLAIDESKDGYIGSQGGGGGEDGVIKHGVSIAVTIERFKHYVLNECPVPAAVTSHIVDGDTLIVECPDWLRFNPQSIPEEKKEEVRRPLQRQNAEDRNAPIKLNREERRKLAHEVARGLRHR